MINRRLSFWLSDLDQLYDLKGSTMVPEYPFPLPNVLFYARVQDYLKRSVKQGLAVTLNQHLPMTAMYLWHSPLGALRLNPEWTQRSRNTRSGLCQDPPPPPPLRSQLCRNDNWKGSSLREPKGGEAACPLSLSLSLLQAQEGRGCCPPSKVLRSFTARAGAKIFSLALCWLLELFWIFLCKAAEGLDNSSTAKTNLEKVNISCFNDQLCSDRSRKGGYILKTK